MIVRDMYIRRTPFSGKPIVTRHRVWDAERFLAAQRQQALAQAQRDSTPPDSIQEATAADFKPSGPQQTRA